MKRLICLLFGCRWPVRREGGKAYIISTCPRCGRIHPWYVIRETRRWKQ